MRLAAKVRHAKTVSVGGDAAHHAFQDGMILMQLAFRECIAGYSRVMGPKRSESITANGTRAHGENVAQDSADAGGRALKRLDE